MLSPYRFCLASECKQLSESMLGLALNCQVEDGQCAASLPAQLTKV